MYIISGDPGFIDDNAVANIIRKITIVMLLTSINFKCIILRI